MKSVGPSGTAALAMLLLASKKGPAMKLTILTSKRRASLLLMWGHRCRYLMRARVFKRSVFYDLDMAGQELTSTCVLGDGDSGAKNTRFSHEKAQKAHKLVLPGLRFCAFCGCSTS